MAESIAIVIALFDVGGGELVMLLVIALVLFGGDLPRVARSVGRVVSDLRRQAEGLTREFRDFDAPLRPRIPTHPYPPARAPEPAPRVERTAALPDAGAGDAVAKADAHLAIESPAGPPPEPANEPIPPADRRESDQPPSL